MQNERDHRGADAVEDRGDGRQPFEADVERPERGDDDEVRQDERPASGPRAPESAADVRDPDADLDGERSGEGLADRDPLAHLLFRQPLLLADELSFHLTDQCDGAAEAEEAETQVVLDELLDGHTFDCLRSVHGILRGRLRRSVTFDDGCSKRYGEY